MIAIFISEEQVLRNYFLACEWNIVPSHEKTLLIANREVYPILSRLSSRGEIPIKHTVMPLKIEVTGNYFLNLCISLLRNLSHSPSVLRQIKREQELKTISKAKSHYRIFFYKLSGVVPSIQKLARLLLFFQSRDQSVEKLLIDSNVRIAIALAITNPEDAIFLMNARRLGVRTIASTRSWDNLSSHGALLFEPDALIIHSKLMRKQLETFQKISKKCEIFERNVPWYSSKLKQLSTPAGKANPKPDLRVLYACTGPYHFPNEAHYLDALSRKLQHTGIELTVLQHPKSQHPLQLFTPSLKIEMFPYLNSQDKSSLVSYYQFLHGFDLILGSGSTVLLDALFLGKKISAFFPENISGYWASISRYEDTMQHYSEFISRLGIKTFSDLDDLAKSLNNIETIHVENENQIDYFIGDQHAKDLNLGEFIGQN